ncbi:DUF2867 domain-containing protein [Phytopseudomonas dryadis]|nr:DUF2867 domain-containing protein [Pseudomonas dryadis]
MKARTMRGAGQQQGQGGFSVLSVKPPATASVASWYAGADLVDAFSIDLPIGTTGDPMRLAEFVFAIQPAWIAALMFVRDTLVRPLGIKTSRRLQAEQGTSAARHIGIFRVYASGEREVILGEDDRHLDFRVSALRQPKTEMDGDSDANLVVTTVVRCHNRLGRVYITAIRFFHQRVVIASLQHAAWRGWPARETAEKRR